MSTLQYTARDLHVAACTVYGEARGEPWEGQHAVAWVLRNRATRRRFAGSLAGLEGALERVCRAPWQFSCWNKGDPNSVRLGAALEKARNTGLLVDMDRQVLAIRAALDTDVADPTNGADHYHTLTCPSWADEWPPGWSDSMKPVALIGEHVFYNSEEARR